MKKNKLLFGGILLLVVVGIIAIYNISGDDTYSRDSNSISEPEKIVLKYFNSWNDKDYNYMYTVLSDGFKKIDPYAINFDSFEKYSSSQGINGVEVNSIKGGLNNGKVANVDYSVNFILDNGNSIPFNSSFTLKYRENDKNPGWKLIHPYGENVDIS